MHKQDLLSKIWVSMGSRFSFAIPTELPIDTKIVLQRILKILMDLRFFCRHAGSLDVNAFYQPVFSRSTLILGSLSKALKSTRMDRMNRVRYVR